MTKKNINVVVTDLDDTIWDWLRMWHSSFEPYLHRISTDFNIDIDKLKSDFKALHQKYGTTEASHIYTELLTLAEKDIEILNNSKRAKRSIIHEYNSNKKNSLFLYAGVRETLQKLKSVGCLVIGFTESNSFYTKYRIKHLKLDGLLDCVYAPLDFNIPKEISRFYDEDFWEPELTEFRYLSRKIKKPDEEILEIILKDFKVDKNQVIYIGDKLDRDIYMAQKINVLSVYAKYGHQISNEKYELLREVTHWTNEDVEREKDFRNKYASLSIQAPDFVLEYSYAEIFDKFDFFCYPGKPDKEKLDQVIAVWEKTVTTQEHFNDLELRIRNYALTIFTFTFAAIGYSEKEKISIKIFDEDIKASALLCIVGIITMFVFFYMDRFWYHKLLQGAVKQGLDIEKKWKKYLPEMGLSTAIGQASPHKFWKFTFRSNHKFFIFYLPLIIILVILFFAIIFSSDYPVVETDIIRNNCFSSSPCLDRWAQFP